MGTFFDDASLVMIPSGVKESKLYSIKPSNGDGDFTFTRGTDTATRVNSAGNIEKETQNLLLQSNTFDTSWNSYNLSRTVGANDFDGGTNAWTIAKLGSYGLINQSVSNTGVHTFSVYAKAGTLNFIALTTSASPFSTAYFDLQNGVVGSLVNAIDSNIESVGGGWYRCSLTSNVTASGFWRIYPADSDGGLSNANLGNVIIYKAQLEQGLVARTYIETTTAAVYAGITDNLPRLDYSGGASCPSLLLEPQRTNLATLSEHIGGWSSKSNATTTSNYTTSPEGVQNATRVQFTTPANGYVFNSGAPAQVSGATYTLSCYAKRNDSGAQSFGFWGNGAGAVQQAMALTSDWKRFEYTYTATNASQLGLAGHSGADVSVYGFQVEKDASYATSYIPTMGVSATRANDVCNSAGDSSTFNDSEGVLYAEISALANDGVNRVITIVNSSTTINRVRLYYTTVDNRVIAEIRNASGGFLMIYNGLSNATTFNKFAVKYKNNDSALWVNGTEVLTNTSGGVPVGLNSLNFDDGSGSDDFYGKTKQILTFKTALSDSELATLTTL